MRRWLIPASAIVIAALIGGLVVFFAAGSGDSAEATVTLEPVNSTLGDPFTTSVAIHETAGDAKEVKATAPDLAADSATGGLTATGTTPGLYGGTQDSKVCDADQLVAFLNANPDKAAAWASVIGIRPSGIKDFVSKLIPVILTTDTRVTNHGYKNGKATSLQSVLQAGTAVMVDARGVPRVKCACGNPLGEPTTITNATYTGNQWDGYEPAQTATITPAPKPVPTITITDVTTGDPYTEPTGATTTDGTMYVEDGVSFLYSINENGNIKQKVGLIRTDTASPAITDIAARDDGTLYATSFTQLYRIDPKTAKATPVGSGYRSVTNINALEFLPDGTLLGANTDGDVASVDPESGATKKIGAYGRGLGSSGDLVTAPNGTLLGTATRGSGDDVLVAINPSSGKATVVGSDLGFRNVYGMFVDTSDQLLGFLESSSQCANGAMIRIDPSAGTAKFRRCTDYSAFGATRLPKRSDGDVNGGKIRAVDLLNRSYSGNDTCLPPDLTLVDGSWELTHDAATFDKESATAKVTYLDATGDGDEDAVVAISYSGGGNSVCTTYVVLAMKDGKAVEVGRIAGANGLADADARQRARRDPRHQGAPLQRGRSALLPEPAGPAGLGVQGRLVRPGLRNPRTVLIRTERFTESHDTPRSRVDSSFSK